MGADLNLYDWAGRALTPGLLASPRKELVVVRGMGKYAAASLQAKSWSLSTAAAGITVAAANVSASGGTPVVGLFNPQGNKFRASIIRTVIWTVSGTAGGPLVWNIVRNAAITAGGGAGAINQDTFIPGNADGVLTFVNAAITGVSSGTMLRGIGGNAAVAAGAGSNSVSEDTGGNLIIEPGNFAGIFATAAGTSHVAGASIEFETIAV
jgi:hypothetical protein